MLRKKKKSVKEIVLTKKSLACSWGDLRNINKKVGRNKNSITSSEIANKNQRGSYNDSWSIEGCVLCVHLTKNTIHNSLPSIQLFSSLFLFFVYPYSFSLTHSQSHPLLLFLFQKGSEKCLKCKRIFQSVQTIRSYQMIFSFPLLFHIVYYRSSIHTILSEYKSE